MRKISGFNAVPAIIGSCLICISCGEKPVTPTLTTVNVDFVTSTTAVSGGNVTSDGGAPIVARGVCWSTASNPVIADDTTMVAGELGQFESFITGLTPSTKYFLRAYATNEAGTGYGYQMAFTTEPPVRIPLVTTGEITSTGSIYVISGGTMTDNGGEPCTVGICWGTSHNPAVTGSKDIKYLAEAGTFTCTMTGLSASTPYFVRAFATNSAGTGYGDEISVTTTDGPVLFNNSLTYGSVTDIDGNVYKTIQIGTQTWMAEDLRATKYSNGTAIQLVETDAGWAALTTTSKAYSFYNNDPGSTSSFGAFYTWAAAMNGAASSNNTPSGVQGVCPTGWHLPSDAEWTAMKTALGGESVAGGKLRETGTTHWQSPNVDATNESGFTALPGGNRFVWNGMSYGNSLFGYWWSSTEYSAENAWITGLSTYGAEVNRYFGYEKKAGYSVRCVKD